MAREIIEVPLTGEIISVNVKPGDEVKEEHTLCLPESMKMKNSILAPLNSTITEVKVAVEQVVKPVEIIATIEY